MNLYHFHFRLYCSTFFVAPVIVLNPVEFKCILQMLWPLVVFCICQILPKIEICQTKILTWTSSHFGGHWLIFCFWNDWEFTFFGQIRILAEVTVYSTVPGHRNHVFDPASMCPSTHRWSQHPACQRCFGRAARGGGRSRRAPFAVSQGPHAFFE